MLGDGPSEPVARWLRLLLQWERRLIFAPGGRCTLVVRACSGARRTARVVVRREDGGPANANAGGREVGDYFRSRRRTDLFVALPRKSGTVQARPERPSTEESLYYVNTTGVSPVSIGLVERLMTTCYWCRHVGGEGCDPMGSAVQVQVLVLCTFSTDPGRINTKQG